MLAYLPHGTVKTKTSTLSSLLLNENVSLLVTEIPQVSAGKGDSIFFLYPLHLLLLRHLALRISQEQKCRGLYSEVTQSFSL